MQGVGVVLNKLSEMLPMAGATTPLGKAIMRAIEALAKEVPPGTVSPQAQSNTLQQMQMKNQQQQATMKQMNPAAGGGAPGGQQPPMAA